MPSTDTKEFFTQQLTALVCFVPHGRVSYIQSVVKKDKKDAGTKRTFKTNRPTRTVSIVDPPAEDPVQEDLDVIIANRDEILSDGEQTAEGKQLFGFRTPKRAKICPVFTPKSVTDAVPRSGRKRTIEATTPYRLAKRTQDIDDSSEDSDESDFDSEVGTSDAESVNSVERASTHHVPNMTEDFFKAQTSKPVTSDRTLSSVKNEGIISLDELHNILAKRPNQYRKSIELLHAEHCQMFNIWMLQLCSGFNLVLYGYGSKKKILEEFRKRTVSQYHSVVINGFFPSLTLKNIMSSICMDCFDMDEPGTDHQATVRTISEYLDRKGSFKIPQQQDCELIEKVVMKGEALFIFVHNIDGPMLRGSTAQTTLASLGALPNVHIIATIDHINSPLLWSQSLVTKFRWLWYDATTFEPYIEETSYENSLMSQQGGVLALRSMINVYKSLTPNAKNIFLLMAKYHMEHCGDTAYIGIPFQALYQRCRESFLVNSDQTLRTQLTEYRDHKLVKTRKGPDGTEHVFIPVDSATLNDFMEQAEKP